MEINNNYLCSKWEVIGGRKLLKILIILRVYYKHESQEKEREKK